MRILHFIWPFLIILSCSSPGKNELYIFNNTRFLLLENEKNVSINADITKNYFSYFSCDSFQIPLYKYINNDFYEIFIGIPLSTSISELYNAQLFSEDNKNILMSTSDSVSYYYKKHIINSFFLAEYAVDVNGNLIYVLTVSESEELSDSLFNLKAISERIMLIK